MNALGKRDHEFLGSEFDWIAQDQHGNFGYFSTAGEGWIPEYVLTNAKSFWNSLEIVSALPVVGEQEITFLGNHDIDDWLKAAARGFFAFDWNRGTKRYELVARPTGRGGDEAVRQIENLTRITTLPCSFSTDFAYRGPTV